MLLKGFLTSWCQGLQSCVWSVHTHTSSWEREAQEESESVTISLSLSSFAAVCFVFQSLQTSTSPGMIWNKEFGQSKSKKGLYFSVYSTRFEGILCWGRVAVLCLKSFNCHLKILKLNYMQLYQGCKLKTKPRGKVSKLFISSFRNKKIVFRTLGPTIRGDEGRKNQIEILLSPWKWVCNRKSLESYCLQQGNTHLCTTSGSVLYSCKFSPSRDNWLIRLPTRQLFISLVENTISPVIRLNQFQLFCDLFSFEPGLLNSFVFL